MNGGGATRHAEACFPFWVNDVGSFTSVPQGRAPSSCSLLRLRDLFRCDLADPGECWQHILLSSYVTDLRWLLATVPELSAVTGKLVVLSGEKGTATLRRTTGDPSSPYTATSPLMDRVNPFMAALREQARATSALHTTLSRERLAVLEPPLPVAFGTHHTKMALCVNSRGLRISIFTANLVEQDWCWKSQGIYLQDFPWKAATECSNDVAAGATVVKTAASSTSKGGNGSNTLTKGAEFVAHLRNYLMQCGVSLTTACASPTDAVSAAGPLGIFETDFLSHIDFSAAAVWLISSVPGTCAYGEVAPGYRVGLCRLAEVLRRSALTMATAPASVDLSWQYSSQGSLNLAFLNSLQAAMCGESVSVIESGDTPRGVRDVQVVYPTEEEVRNSWEGWRGGGSLPLRVQCCHEFVNARLHRWGSSEEGHTAKRAFPRPAKVAAAHASREDAVDVDGVDSDGGEGTTASLTCSCAAYRQFALPHIKSYAAVAPDRSCVRWFLLTSANLSQAAWGSLSRKMNQRGSRQQLVRSYELGVIYDSHSAIHPSASSWFSVVSKTKIELPSARNSRAMLYETPLGVETQNVCLYTPYNLLCPTPYASTAALRARRDAPVEGEQAVAGSTLDCSDVPWVLDMPHRGRDAYGLDFEEAFESSVSPNLSKWQPRTRAMETAPLHNIGAPRKRTREA
ncbi:tyrosyl-DNA phosphodiesterase-like protein [Leishmania mexicana MHOM/GT/2001/U1103]|uniref:Tyrosyl-DNA phosphodiesterase-like protein n=1 Tax=Leishmania mexicana (strain MHOM/GT/2001/U1103) TaxID=929439 RepID=E9B4E6_LEIMU|nr:tyrosyl-DNA phosphodiesterase-like protein [Leishmania mexicana MHOM/GT/2001/U1103]CBZ30114.1 tyrosyl-DNA phosphodiesterase-like protein [Leishmania mexicana MHOM/GT/2001/U1103]